MAQLRQTWVVSAHIAAAASPASGLLLSTRRGAALGRYSPEMNTRSPSFYQQSRRTREAPIIREFGGTGIFGVLLHFVYTRSEGTRIRRVEGTDATKMGRDSYVRVPDAQEM